MNKTVRAKFNCISVTKTKGWSQQAPFNYAVEFEVVTGGASEEDKQFFAATPSGRITMGVLNGEHFEPGRTYYVDFVEAGQ